MIGQNQILRWEKGRKPARVRDELAAEEPLEIRIDNHSIAVTMRTPGNDEELAAGFILTEGLISRRAQILKIAPYPRNRDKNVLGVFLAPDVKVDLKQLTRHVFVSSSCGLCGKASIAAVQRHFPRVTARACVAAELVLSLPDKLRAGQETFGRTGGLHAAGLFGIDGGLLALREDVGRHNAVDKALGWALLHDMMPLDRHILLVSGRASFEIMQKALAAGIPIVAAVSAPSSLAVEFARVSGQTLIGFLRGERMNVYSHSKRLRF